MSGHSHAANIKHKKNLMDAKKGKVFSKLGKAILIAARKGGGDPAANLALRYAIDKAKAANMPKDTIERAVLKGTGGLDGESLEEAAYEGYAPGGVAILVEILTDNKNRTAAEIRKMFDVHGGNLSGAVAWMFQSKGIVVIKQDSISEDEIIELALEAGAEDIQTIDGYHEITCAPADFSTVRQAVIDRGITPESAEITKVPQSTVKLDDATGRKVLKLVDELEDHDDVQNVYANYEVSDAVLSGEQIRWLALFFERAHGLMKAQKQTDQMFQVGTDFGEKIVANVKQISGTIDDVLYKEAMFTIFLKAYKTYQAIITLWKAGFPEDAFVLARTLFELSLQARYLAEDPKAHGRLYAGHDPVMRYRLYLDCKKAGIQDVVTGIESHATKLAELKKYYDSLKKDYPEHKGWWGHSIRWLARHLGSEMEKRYVITYWMQSNLVHSAVTVGTEYLQEEETGHLMAYWYPSLSDDVKYPMEATRYFLDIAGHVAGAFAFGDETKAFEDRFQKIVSELRN